MRQPSLDDLCKQVPSRYALANAIAKRAEQLSAVKDVAVFQQRTGNPLTVAMEELVKGKVRVELQEDETDASE